jgi:hypothetical protein
MTKRDDKKLCEIKAVMRSETEKAFRIFDGKTTDWVPKQFVEDNRDGTFTMPEWLAIEKGFI